MARGRVLLVEPNPGISIVARNVLVRANFEVCSTSTCEEANKVLAKSCVDVAVLDAREAKLSLLLALHRSGARDTVITLRKGRDVVDLARFEEHVDVVAAVEKPFVPGRLLTAVEAALERKKEREEPTVDEPFELLIEEVYEDPAEVYPFAALLQNDPESPVFEIGPRPQEVTGEHTARMARRIENALVAEGIPYDPRHVNACVRVCESVLEREALDAAEDEEISGRLALTGYLDRVPIDQVLQFAARVSLTALCRIRRFECTVDLYFRDGTLVFARQENLPEGYRLGGFLVASGAIEPGVLNRSLDPRAGFSRWIGQRLVSLGYIDGGTLKDALQRQVAELAYEVVRWNNGRFSVFSEASIPPEALEADVTLRVEQVLLEGMQRIDEWQRLTGLVGGPGALIDRVQEARIEEVLDRLTGGDREVWESLEGQRTVKDLVQTVRLPTYEVYRALQSLVGLNLIAVVPRDATA